MTHLLYNGWDLLYPPHDEVVGGYIGFTPSVHPSVRPSVCLSICPSVRSASRVRSVAPIVLDGFISYLYILSSNFRRCVACKVYCKIYCKICNFDFVFFWLGIWCESLVLVIMGQRGGISERRRSNCSSWFRKSLGAAQATSHYLNQWWLVYWCIYVSLGLNELMFLFMYSGMLQGDAICICTMLGGLVSSVSHHWWIENHDLCQIYILRPQLQQPWRMPCWSQNYW